MAKFHYASIEDRNNGLDVNCLNFKYNIDTLIEFIDEKYCGLNKKIVFICMAGSETHDYFITDSHLKAQQYFKSNPNHRDYFLFEESTYEEAFDFCKDCCETHELGLN